MSDWPDGFMWGTGASSTQTEGAAPGSDWYRVGAGGPGPAVGRRQRLRHPLRRGLRALRRARADAPPAVARVGPPRAEAGPARRRRGGALPRGSCRRRETPASRCGPASTTSRSRAGSPTTCTASATTSRAASCGAATSTGWPRPSATSSPGGSRSTSRSATPSARTCSACIPPGRRDRNEAADVLQHDPPGQRRRRPPAAHARRRRWPRPEPAPPDLPRRGHGRRDRRGRRSASTSCGWESWADDEQLDAYDYIGFSYYSATGVRGDGSLATWPVGGRPGPHGLRAVGRGVRATCSSASPRPPGPAAARLRGRHRHRRRAGAHGATSRTCSASCTTPSPAAIDVARPLLVDRRRQLRVAPRLRRALRPLRPRPQPQARRRGGQGRRPRLTTSVDACARIPERERSADVRWAQARAR